MKRIEDIRPPGKKWTIADQPPHGTEEDWTSAEETIKAAPVVQPEKYRPKKKVWPWLLFFLMAAIITAFCGFELIQAKNKIITQISDTNSNFSDLTDSISKKDFAAISSQISQLDNKTSNSLLILQSVGQDDYIFNLLYPKGKSSKTSALIDSARSAHLLTNSFKKVLDFNFSKSPVPGTNIFTNRYGI